MRESQLKGQEVVGLDIETTGLDPVLDKIRTVSLSTPDATWVIDAFQVAIQELFPVLAGGPLKVIHNAKFDAGFLWESVAQFMPEPIFDTMLADQVINYRSYGRSLKDMVKEYLDTELDKELQLSDWNETLSPEQIQYAARDSAVLLPLYHKLKEAGDHLNLARVLDIENRTVPAMVWMELGGVGFDQERWENLGNIVREEVERLKLELNEVVPGVNWNSTAQVLKALRVLGLDVPDTKQETLESVQSQHPVIQILLEYREAAKQVGTYGETWSQRVHPATQRIHPDWRQIGAETGRMSCRKPNLQNLPRNKDYRACFRPSDGNVLIKADYSQIELRIAAEVSRDARMMGAFGSHQDLHALTACEVLGKTSPEDVSPDERQLAKALNFGLVYGMGAKRLAQHAYSNFNVSLTVEDATQLRAKYFTRFRGLRTWHRRQGSVHETRTVLGRRRMINGTDSKRPYTQLLNSPIQGSGADGLKLALLKMWETRNSVNAFPILAVHDEIVIEVPAANADAAKEWLIRCMTDAMGEILKEVPLVVEAETKDSWG